MGSGVAGKGSRGWGFRPLPLRWGGPAGAAPLDTRTVEMAAVGSGIRPPPKPEEEEEEEEGGARGKEPTTVGVEQKEA